MEVRLDVWHFMRRLAFGCTSESHPLFAAFIGGVSDCIFEWEEDDMELLMSAKKQQLIAEGVPNPSKVAVRKAISRMEAATHCRRRIRGEIKTNEMLEQLILSFSTATDTMGVPLLKDEMP